MCKQVSGGLSDFNYDDNGFLAMGQKENPNGDHRFWSMFPFTSRDLGSLF